MSTRSEIFFARKHRRRTNFRRNILLFSENRISHAKNVGILKIGQKMTNFLSDITALNVTEVTGILKQNEIKI